MLRKLAGLRSRNFVFVLGNHEIWNFPGLPMDEIADKYRTVLKKNGMFLLHNDLFYRNESDDIGIIPYDELIQSDNKALLEKLRCARLVILGGLGFSGYNEDFNAMMVCIEQLLIEKQKFKRVKSLNSCMIN